MSEQLDKDLAALSDAATPGLWHLYVDGGTIQISDGPEPTNQAAVVHWAGFDSGDKRLKEKKANAKFITALVNAYRAGELVRAPVTENAGNTEAARRAVEDGDVLTREHDQTLRAAAFRLIAAVGDSCSDCDLDILQLAQHALATLPSKLASGECSAAPARRSKHG